MSWEEMNARDWALVVDRMDTRLKVAEGLPWFWSCVVIVALMEELSLRVTTCRMEEWLYG